MEYIRPAVVDLGEPVEYTVTFVTKFPERIMAAVNPAFYDSAVTEIKNIDEPKEGENSNDDKNVE